MYKEYINIISDFNHYYNLFLELASAFNIVTHLCSINSLIISLSLLTTITNIVHSQASLARIALDESNLRRGRDISDLLTRLDLQVDFNSNPFTLGRRPYLSTQYPPNCRLIDQPRLLLLLNNTIVLSGDPKYTIKPSTLKIYEVRNTGLAGQVVRTNVVFVCVVRNTLK